MATVARNPRVIVSNRVPLARLPRICVSIQGTTASELLARAEQAAKETSLIELRLDTLKVPSSAMAALRDFHRTHPEVNVIATCRKQSYGGEFKGTIQAEWEILTQAAEAGCSLVDLSVQSATRLGSESVAELRERTNLILSWHDFEATPDLETQLAQMRRIPADIYKLVPTAKQFGDNLKLLQFASRHSQDVALVTFGMGEAGLASRILAVRAGAAFTFAAAENGLETAPGQLDLAEMRGKFRLDEITRATRVFGVIGHPVAHSLSPLMMNAAFRRTGFNGVYLPLAIKKPAEILTAAEQLPLSGFSVTIPHKTAVVPLLHDCEPLAKKIGAVNTVVRSEGRLYGYNTDVAGILGPLTPLLSLPNAKVLVVGAGGAARAAVFGLRSRGAQVWIFNRTPARAQALATAARAKVVKRPELRKLNFDLIINATPVGQTPKVKDAPLEINEIRAHVVFDLVYNPLETELIRRARQAGARVIPGVEMFLQQGARQFQIWTGKPAPQDEMRGIVLKSLR